MDLAERQALCGLFSALDSSLMRVDMSSFLVESLAWFSRLSQMLAADSVLALGLRWTSSGSLSCPSSFSMQSRALARTARARLWRPVMCSSVSEWGVSSNPSPSPMRRSWMREMMVSRISRKGASLKTRAPSCLLSSSGVHPRRTTWLAKKAVSAPVLFGSVNRQRLSKPRRRASMRSFMSSPCAISSAMMAFSSSLAASFCSIVSIRWILLE
mmetsp:Transcript_5360/g.15744  ORF Transcript_5360/g.15744 Transcript_5360/m.15744 type:complete len:213 (-) Transcript_5360:979-1617(-)